MSTSANINLRGSIQIHLGMCADIAALYGNTEAGRAFMRSLPIVIPVEALRHIQKKDEQHRLAVLERRAHLITQAIQSPTLIYRSLDHRPRLNQYRQAFVAQDSRNADVWLTVAVILANLPGNPRSPYHRVVTIHPAKTRDFFDATGALKQRWIQAK